MCPVLTAQPKPLFPQNKQDQDPALVCAHTTCQALTLGIGTASNIRASLAGLEGWLGAGDGVASLKSSKPAVPSARGSHHSSTQAALSCAFKRWKRFVIGDFDHLGVRDTPLLSCCRAVSVHPSASPALCVAVCKLRVQMTGK